MRPTYFKQPRLGVNIDHVATVRQARGESYPSLSYAAEVALKAGAEQITIHLREDRRHIQDFDLPKVKEMTTKYGSLLNLELSTSLEMFPIAVATSPAWLCLVPEKREERTTEGGLNLKDNNIFQNVKNFCEKWKATFPANHKISLFLEADELILKRAMELPIEAVEIHTGAYAKSFLMNENLTDYFDRFSLANQIVYGEHQKQIHAGHGLTIDSVVPLVEKGFFAEYNIGHWIVSQALFDGLAVVVKKLNSVLKK